MVYIKMANEYNRKHKKGLQKEAHERYQNLSEEKEKKRPEKDLKILLKT